jgi:hypothetical protein
MGPDDGLNELLPVAPAREEKHQAEGPNKVSTKEEQPVASTGRSVRLNDLTRFRPEELIVVELLAKDPPVT